MHEADIVCENTVSAILWDDESKMVVRRNIPRAKFRLPCALRREPVVRNGGSKPRVIAKRRRG